MKEVEVLVQVFDSRDAVLERLKQFNFVGIKDVYDIYYYHPDNKSMQIVKGKYPREWLRLRKCDKNHLAFKKDHFDGEKWLYSDEHEVEVSDYEAVKSIFHELGFKPLVELQIRKHTYSNETYEIVFEEVENLGFFLEVEKLKVQDIAEAKKQICEFIKSLGIKVGDDLNLGKPELMLQKSGLFKPE